jgi:hypothetical protein
MTSRLLLLLCLALGLLASACADQTSFGPSTQDDHRPAARAVSRDTTFNQVGTGGSAGGLKGRK